MLKNGNFENGMEGWSLNTYGETPKVTKDAKQTHAGHPSMRVDLSDAGDTSLEQAVTVKPATRYHLSGWIKTEKLVKPEGPKQRSGEAGASLSLAGTYDKTANVANTNDWTNVSMDFSSRDKSIVKVGPRLGHYGKWVMGTAWFSEISLVELGPDLAAAHPPSVPVPAPVSKPPAESPGDLATLGNLVRSNHGSLVFVSGANGAGSGFIAGIGGANYLITNAHVAAAVKGAAFKSLDGSQIQAGAPSVAVDHDIFRMALPPGGKPFELMEHVDANAAIGDDIVVLGNAEGAGVINTIKGRIVGIGPNLIEVDATFVPGNSGSPIVHLKTGKVIGVATYALIRKYEATTKEPVKEPVIRRFGYRIDSVTSWQPVNSSAFAGQAAAMESIEKLTVDLGKLLSDIASNHKITPGLHNNPAIKLPIDLWAADRGRKLSPSDKAMSEENFVSRLKSACQTDLTTVRPQLTYDYFQRKLADEQRYRDDISSVLDKLFQAGPGR